MKIVFKILAIATVILTITSALAINATSFAQATTPTWTWDGGMIANPPHFFLDPSFNARTFYNPHAAVGGAPFCDSGVSHKFSILCYPPDFIRKAYDFPILTAGALLPVNVVPSTYAGHPYPTVAAQDGVNGTGSTIVIVDAFGSPTIATDLSDFDGNFSIPAPPSFQVLCGPSWTYTPSPGYSKVGTCPALDYSNANANAPNEVGWAEEITLDVTQAHALAPGANIVLVVSNSDFDSDLNAAEAAVVAQSSLAGSVMTQSFGEPENVVGCTNFPTCTPALYDPSIKAGQDDNYRNAALAGWTVLASSGDDGANEGYSVWPTAAKANLIMPSSPATNQYVLAVGGTQGQPYGGQYGYNIVIPNTPGNACAAGATCNTGLVIINGGANGCTNATRPGEPSGCTPSSYGGEGAWNEFNALGPRSSTGGGISTLYGRPEFQAALPSSFAVYPSGSMAGTGRLYPDISFNSAVAGGVLSYCAFLQFAGTNAVGANNFARWVVFGGTSASSPAWAGIVALLNQENLGPVGYINPAIYSLAQTPLYAHSFHDVTVGNNTDAPPATKGYPALTGYDLTTGWGSVDVNNFLTDFMTVTYGHFNLVGTGTPSGVWNLFSYPLVPQNNAISTMLSGLVGDKSFDIVWGFVGGSWKYAMVTGTPPHLTGTLATIQDGVGYWIHMLKDDQIQYSIPSTGWVIQPAMAAPKYPLSLGWNLIGYKPSPTVGTETVSTFLASITGDYDTAHVEVYDAATLTWSNASPSTTLSPGEAMWIFVTTATTLVP